MSSNRFPRYIQIYEPFTLNDSLGNSITFNPGATPSFTTNSLNLKSKVVNLNAYDFVDFMDHLKSVFDVSFVVQDDDLLTRHSFISVIYENHGINFSIDGSNSQIVFNNKYDNSNNYAITGYNDGLYLQSDKKIVLSNNSNLDGNIQHVIIDNSGNLGVGIDPLCNLHISGGDIKSTNTIMENNENKLFFSLDNIDSSLNRAINLHDKSIIFNNKNILDHSNNSLFIGPLSNFKKGIKIDHSGNLHNYNNLFFPNHDTSNNFALHYDMSYNNLNINYNSSSLFSFDASGKFGIGINNPQNNLHIYQDSSSSSLLLGEKIDISNRSILIKYNQGTVTNNGVLQFKHSGDNDDKSFYFQNGGNVGIGVKEPLHNLHIYGDSSNSTILLGSDISNNVGSYINYYQGDISGFQIARMYLGHYDSNDNKGLNILSNGNIGIGTTNPLYPLDIRNNVAGGVGWTGFIDGDTSISKKNSNSQISINAQYGIFGSSVGVYSDSRIKNKISNIDSSKALKCINQLKPVTFDYIDTWYNGDGKNFGFIAQDVRNVIPESCITMNKYIPSIYEYCKINDDIIELNEKDTSSFVMNKFDNISKEKYCNIEIFDTYGNRDNVKIIQILSNKKFKITNISNSLQIHDNSIFVYGQEIDDFYAIKQDSITTINTSAIKELNNKLDETNKQLELRDKKIDYLEQLITNLSTRIFKLEQNDD